MIAQLTAVAVCCHQYSRPSLVSLAVPAVAHTSCTSDYYRQRRQYPKTTTLILFERFQQWKSIVNGVSIGDAIAAEHELKPVMDNSSDNQREVLMG